MTTSYPLDASASWLSFHIFFPNDHHRVLTTFVFPLIRSMYAAGELDSFFFIHYPEGGLHVRLRLLPRAGRQNAVTDRVYAAHAGSMENSAEPLRLEIFEVPFEPETERYGGRELLSHSLDFFCISSVIALEFSLSHGLQSRTNQLSRAFRLLGQQALGLAGCVEEFLRLAGYMSFRWDEDPGGLQARGDRVFEQRREDFVAAMRALVWSFNRSSDLGSSDGRWGVTFAEAAILLSSATQTANASTRQSIGISQMHMTANRLALDNHEEAYIARLLWRAASELASSDQNLWHDLQTRYGLLPAKEMISMVPWPEVRQQYLSRLSETVESRG